MFFVQGMAKQHGALLLPLARKLQIAVLVKKWQCKSGHMADGCLLAATHECGYMEWGPMQKGGRKRLSCLDLEQLEVSRLQLQALTFFLAASP